MQVGSNFKRIVPEAVDNTAFDLTSSAGYAASGNGNWQNFFQFRRQNIVAHYLLEAPKVWSYIVVSFEKKVKTKISFCCKRKPKGLETQQKEILGELPIKAAPPNKTYWLLCQ